MKINLIAAVNRTGGIGFNNLIPWSLPEDLKYFKQVTMGHPIIMGRNTFDSLSNPLPGRLNIVVTSRPLEISNPELVIAVRSYGDALEIAKQSDPTDVFIVGGLSAYREFWNVADRLFLTRVDVFTESDTVLDLLDLHKDWELYTKSSRLVSKYEPYIKYSHEVYLKKQLDLFN